MLTIEPPPARQQRRHRGAHAQERPGLVDRDDAIPELVVGVRDPAAIGDAGVVDEHVEPAPQRLGEGDRRLPVGPPRHVQVDVARLAACIGDLAGDLRALVVGDVAEQHPRTLAGEQPGLGLALSAGSARDQRDLAVEPAHVSPPSRPGRRGRRPRGPCAPPSGRPGTRALRAPAASGRPRAARAVRRCPSPRPGPRRSRRPSRAGRARTSWRTSPVMTWSLKTISELKLRAVEALKTSIIVAGVRPYCCPTTSASAVSR